MRQGDSTRDLLADLKKDTQNLQQAAGATTSQQPWSPELVKFLSTSILAFGLGVMLIMGWLVVRRGITQGVLRLICVPLIVVAAVFLMVVGYDDKQLTPIVGLLGTIAGYLLGRTDTPSPNAPGRRGGTSEPESTEASEVPEEGAAARAAAPSPIS